MKSYLLKSGLIVLSAVMLPVTVAQADSASDGMQTEAVSRYWISPDARPDFPQTAARGAQGPIREYDATTNSRDEADKSMYKGYDHERSKELMFGGA